ncbi:Tannase/feruloyl esterase [Coniella lustricola]|uniref:Carboxylic ester hydrolase n=1 Tax=Coniella lustricola TaxID=2025994 RepID=A0A2T2ZXJ4_9PEZI|nr:Tannase/feruloyl esterase [Coniella lustricola]
MVQAASLQDICQASYVQSRLPTSPFISGITIDESSVSASVTLNYTTDFYWYPDTTIDYCNVTLAYSHDGIAGDKVHVSYWLPAPSAFENRYLSTGGGGFAINSGTDYIPNGIINGAVSGITDGGFGNFDTEFDAAFLLANGTINWEATYMFGYQAHHELAVLGKELARSLYNVSSDERIYSYYQGCSEGGREGWSQVQRFADQFDGAVIGAPAFRYGQQQVNHLTSNVIQQTLGYFPPTCELEKIMNLTIEACDGMDGRVDGVVSRSDLCLLNFDVNSTIGTAYSCDANTAVDFGSISHGAQNGTVTAEGAAVAASIWAGLYDSEGDLVYISYQPGTIFYDGETEYDEATGTWLPVVSSLGGPWITKFLQLRDTEVLSLDELSNYTVDTLKEFMIEGMNRYADSLQTTYPDLSPFQAAGGKVLHLHGEQDFSIPTGSSVHYYESVRSVMYGNLGYNESVAALDDFYRLFLVPGAAHCSANDFQPNSGWPETTLPTMIEWVESGIAPATLTGSGNIDQICRWPLRPLWSNNGTSFDCVYDQESLDTWDYDFNAYKLPLY